MKAIGFTDTILGLQHWWHEGECVTLPQFAVRQWHEGRHLVADWNEVRRGR